jgi:predicted MPP superfamily phosphohydrolase
MSRIKKILGSLVTVLLFKTYIAFFATILVFLYLANFVVYQAVLIVFSINENSFITIVILGFFSLSFIASILLGRKRYNFFTRVYSIISMVWMGFFAYFLIASFIYIIEFAYIGDSSRHFALILFGLTTLVGIYGLFHAKKLIIKEVIVGLPNLSEVWKGRKVVLICDLHIGQINGKNFVESVVEKLKQISPDIVLIGGDLFDGSSAQGVLNCIVPFSSLSIPLGIYFVTGNHEVYGNSDLLLEAVKKAGIKTLHDEKVVIDGLQIVGVDYKTTTKELDFKNVLINIQIERNIPSILLKHEPSHIGVAEQAGISMQMSGHTHKAQQWPLEYFAKMAYGRFENGLNQLGKTQVYTTSGVGTWGPPLRVGTDSEIVVFTFK